MLYFLGKFVVKKEPHPNSFITYRAKNGVVGIQVFKIFRLTPFQGVSVNDGFVDELGVLIGLRVAAIRVPEIIFDDGQKVHDAARLGHVGNKDHAPTVAFAETVRDPYSRKAMFPPAR